MYVLFSKLPLKVSFLVCSLGSYMERSTVDFIVPGEMELTSAVRSVSCGSTINKCNGSVPPSAMASNSAASKALLPHNKVSSYLFTFVCLYFFLFTHFNLFTFFRTKMAVVVATMGTTKKSMDFIRKTFIKIPCWDMVIWDLHQEAFRCLPVIGHPLHMVVVCPQLVIVKEECPIQCCPFQVVRAVARYSFHEILFLIFAIFPNFNV